ncbi:MAG: hypothetical protein IKB02_06200 [Clostridia bacterium]|nr:hypothetical protein [Clostridia bacterium]
MKIKVPKTLLKNIGIAVVCLCVLSYSVFHVSSLFSEEIGTIVVGPTTEKEGVSISGYIFRDATPIYAKKYNGAIEYLVKNGEKVAVSDELAVVYEEGDNSRSASLVSVIDENLELLRTTTDKKPSVSQITNLRASASSAYYSIMKQLASGTDIAISADEKKLLVALNSIATLTDEDFDIKKTLGELTSLRESILAAGGESENVRAEKSGYFYTGVDGFEGAFSGEAAKNLDREGFLELFDSQENYRKSYDPSCVGKMSYDSKWYFAAEMKADEAERFCEGEGYSVEFTSGGHFEIEMTVARVLLDADESRAVIVFESNVLPEGFNFRMQTAKIITDTVRGIYVPRSAMHRKGVQKVVYILKGSVVQLRYVDVIYEGADYYLVREEVETEKGDDRVFLSSNELLIVRGEGLFDGRILG